MYSNQPANTGAIMNGQNQTIIMAPYSNNQILPQSKEQQLKENYPTVYVIIHSVVLGILSVLLIAFQSKLIVERNVFYFTGSGIWVGIYFLITVLLTLAISKLLFQLRQELLIILYNF